VDAGPLYASAFPSPIGELTAVVDADGAVVELRFAHQGPPADVTWDDARCAHVRRELEEYFAGERREFGLTLRPRGTEWQRRCWTAVLRIPYGCRLDYREVATIAGNPVAFRAAGRANATNPIPILIPCHRVLSPGGGLTGYGGGLAAKEFLILLEGGQKKERGEFWTARHTWLDDSRNPPVIVEGWVDDPRPVE
jgi:methylated-DNA-[protein]-cysteine S-methyltransferase